MLLYNRMYLVLKWCEGMLLFYIELDVKTKCIEEGKDADKSCKWCLHITLLYESYCEMQRA